MRILDRPIGKKNDVADFDYADLRFNRTMDRLKTMRMFVETADHGSLTRAAEVLDTSLSAVVRGLAALEAHLGVRVLQRTTRHVALTDDGRRYLDSAREVLVAADAADASLKEEARDPSGHLTITAPVLFGHMHVSPVIVRFMQRYTAMRCTVLLFDRTVDLIDEGIDVGVRIGPLADSSLVATRLGSVRQVLVASPRYLAAHGRPSHPRDLVQAPFVRSRVDRSSRLTFQVDGSAIQVTPATRLAFNHVAPAIEACAAGMGFGVFLSYQIRQAVSDGRLEIVLDACEPPPQPVHVVYPHARLLPARTRLFIDWIRNAFDDVDL